MPPVSEELEELVRTMVDHPDEVEVWEVPDGRTVRLELAVDPDDLGKVIGRQGRTARAIRALLDVRGARDGARYELKILEEDDL
ncbi:MAG TPA: KH domain-containing protein [Thermoanaerobaculia bacterium]